MLSTRELRRSARKKPKIVRTWRWLKFVLLAVFGGALVFSTFHIVGYFTEGAQELQRLDALRQAYEQAYGDAAEASVSAGDDAVASEDAAQKAFAALVDMNADAVGWLTVPDTEIDHPVVLTGDNTYYLTHSFENERSAHGCVFMDYRCSERSRHIVLYGHRMKDGSMFGALPQYEIQDYLASHSVIEFNLHGEMTQWQIFSVRRTDDSLLPVVFADDGMFDTYIQDIKNLSMFETGVDVSSDDTVLTLSTCDGSDSQRFVIHAKKVN